MHSSPSSRPDQADHPGHGYPRPEDIDTFLEVYDRALRLPAHECNTLQKLLKGADPLTTTVGQLRRLIDFFGVREFGGPRAARDSGIHLLFAPEKGLKDSGLRPTTVAHELFKRLSILKDFYHDIRDAVRDRLVQPAAPETVRLGTPHTIGLRLLYSIFSCWQEKFSASVKLEVELGNSQDLILRLDAGQIEFLIAFGPKNARHVPQDGLSVEFNHFPKYHSRMVLLCHPTAKVWTVGRNPQDVNAGYWDEAYKLSEEETQKEIQAASKEGRVRKPLQHRRRYDELKPIDLHDIDFHRTTLFLVRSWSQPEGLSQVVKYLRSTSGRLHEVESYDEALALVRMGMGVAPASEVFCTRRHITAFRLDPAKEFTRSIGVYHNTAYGVSARACRLIFFVKEYLADFGEQVQLQQGFPPTFGDPEYEKFCQDFVMERDWETLAQKHFPRVEPNPDGRQKAPEV